jgi:hypothetical protein
MSARFARALPLLFAIFVALILALHFARRLRDPSVVMLVGEGGASWLRAPGEASLLSKKPSIRTCAFRTFVDVAPGATFDLHVRGLRRVIVEVDGQRMFDSGEELSRWKQEHRVPLALTGGRHELKLIAMNELGPAMALAYSDDGGIKSAATWEAASDHRLENWLPAVTAEAPPQWANVPRDAMRSDQALWRVLPWLLPVAAAGAAWGWQRPRWLTPNVVAAALAVLWVVLAINNLPRMPNHLGYDVQAHVEYIAYVAKNHRVPLAGEGWQMFQSPLYYVVSAPLYALLEGRVEPGTLLRVLRIAPILCGLAQVELVRRAARIALPRQPDAQSAALLVGGLMPMNLYISQTLSNEPMSGCLTALAIVVGMRFVRSARKRGDGSLAATGAALGLALLTKVSAVVIAPVLALFAWLVRRHGKWVRGLAVLFGTCALVCGAYYVRNLVHFGRPFVAGWDPQRVAWWQDPGYRTPASLYTFGRSVLYPTYAGLDGLWDSLYSSVWCDGFLSGIAIGDYRPPWNYTLMSALALLSIIPTLAILIGLTRLTRDKCLAFAAACVAVFVLAVIDLYLTLPVYSTAKGTYLLGITPCLAVLAGAGFARIGARPWLRSIFYATLAAWAATAYCTFLINPN